MKRVAVLVSVIAVLGTVPAASPAGPAAKPKPKAPAARAALVSGVLAMVNQVRASNKLAALVVNAQLAAAATEHSQEMLSRGYFAHESADGTSADKRIKKYYRKGLVGENLLWSVPDVGAAQVVEAWMNDPPHRDVILDPRWREIGIAALHASRAPGKYRNRPTTVVTADFGG